MRGLRRKQGGRDCGAHISAFSGTRYIDGQNKGIAALEENGYKRVLKWKNPNSGNTVTLWAQGEFRSLISDERRTKVATKTTKVTKKSKTPVRKTSKGL